MTKDEKLNSIIDEYRNSWLTLYDAFNKAYMAGKLEIAIKYQGDIDNQIDKVNSILDTLKELKNGK